MYETRAHWTCARCVFHTTSSPDVALHEAQNPGHMMLSRVPEED